VTTRRAPDSGRFVPASRTIPFSATLADGDEDGAAGDAEPSPPHAASTIVAATVAQTRVCMPDIADEERKAAANGFLVREHYSVAGK
jgi:hypothetical protein